MDCFTTWAHWFYDREGSKGAEGPNPSALLGYGLPLRLLLYAIAAYALPGFKRSLRHWLTVVA